MPLAISMFTSWSCRSRLARARRGRSRSPDAARSAAASCPARRAQGSRWGRWGAAGRCATPRAPGRSAHTVHARGGQWSQRTRLGGSWNDGGLYRRAVCPHSSLRIHHRSVVNLPMSIASTSRACSTVTSRRRSTRPGRLMLRPSVVARGGRRAIGGHTPRTATRACHRGRWHSGRPSTNATAQAQPRLLTSIWRSRPGISSGITPVS
jgi:hypothetical protein